MAEPTYGAAGTYYTGTGTSHNIAAPASVVSGSVVVIVAYIDSDVLDPGTGAALYTLTPPTGFSHAEGSPNPLGDLAQYYNENKPTANQIILWHRASGAETDPYTLTLTLSRYVEAQAFRFDDVVASGDPFDSPTDAAYGLAAGTTTPAVDITTDGADRLILHAGTQNGTGAWTPHTGYTQRGGGGVNLGALFTKGQAAAGATGSLQATVANSCSRRGAWLGALIPVDTVDTGTLTASIPALTAALAGDVIDTGTLAASIPALTAALAGDAYVLGSLAASIPALAAALTGDVVDTGTLAASIPALTAAINRASVTYPIRAGTVIDHVERYRAGVVA